MTISSTDNRSGPYTLNGVTTAFDYDFKIVDRTHVQVIFADLDGVETILVIDTDYDVTGVGVAEGGQIITNSALDDGTITLLLDVPFLQETDLENQGAYNAEDVEAAFDLAAQRDLQLLEMVTRAVVVPPSSTTDPADLINYIVALGEVTAEIATVAGIAAEVEVVAGIAANVTTVAGIAANVTIVAGIASAVSTVAAIDAEVTTVAANIAAILAAEGHASDAQAAAAAAEGFRDEAEVFRDEAEAAAAQAGTGSFTVYKWTATAGQTVFNGADATPVLAAEPAGNASCFISLGRLLLSADDWTRAGVNFTLVGDSAEAGEVFEVKVATSDILNTVSDGAVTTLKLDVNAVTNAKLAQMAQSTLKGRAAGAGTGDPVDLTPTQALEILSLQNGVAANNLFLHGKCGGL